MTKLKAFFIHLLISILVVGIFFSIVLFIWYPKPFFDISGVIEPLKLLIIVDVIIGPMLTFIVYKKYKKSLKLDLSVIALVQVLALMYGGYTIYDGRPSLVVFKDGSFVYLVEKYSNNEELKFDVLKPNLFSKPKLAYLSKSSALDIYNDYTNFVPLDNINAMVMPFSLSVENMKAQFSQKQEEIDVIANNYKDEDMVFLTLKKEETLYYVVYSKSQNNIIDFLKF